MFGGFLVLSDLYSGFSISFSRGSFQRNFKRLSVVGPNTTISEKKRRQLIFQLLTFGLQ